MHAKHDMVIIYQSFSSNFMLKFPFFWKWSTNGCKWMIASFLKLMYSFFNLLTWKSNYTKIRHSSKYFWINIFVLIIFTFLIIWTSRQIKSSYCIINSCCMIVLDGNELWFQCGNTHINFDIRLENELTITALF